MANTTLGSIVNLNFDGAMREFLVVHQGKPSGLYDESCNGTWVLMKDLYEKHQWQKPSGNSYGDSQVNSYLNSTVFSLFDKNIRDKIREIKIPYRYGKGTKETIYSGENGLSTKIFLLSGREVGFTKENINSYICDDGEKLDYFIDGGNSAGTECKQKRISTLNGDAQDWYLRSPHLNNSPYIWCVTYGGGCSMCMSDASIAIRPALVLPFNLLVSNNGMISVNTAPTIPGSITISANIQGGSAITVKWGMSIDTEENLEGYVVERSVNGGSSWAQIYQGTNCSTSNTIPFGITSIMYRVKAYDSEGLQSDWRTSVQTIVINNHAPSTPSSLIVPEIVVFNEQLPITWGEASDTDGDLSGYILERQIDGGTWTQLYEGTALTFTDNITKGWKTVAYRVKAYDSYNAFSAYVTSETRSVNNNTASAISGQDAALGLKTGSFSQAYTVSDAENNTVTVTEYVDNQVIRSYQAVLGEEAAITISRENWLKLTNGNHQLRVTAYDGVATTARIWTFSKKETVICFQLAAPLETEAAAVKILVSPTWKIDGAAVRVEACNNAFDEAPAWEDITAMLMLKRVYHFTNAAKTADKWGLGIRFTIEKNEGYEGEVSITGFGVAYE